MWQVYKTNTGITVSGTSGGYISSCKCSEYGMIPNVISGSDSTYYCDASKKHKTPHPKYYYTNHGDYYNSQLD